MQRPRKRRLKEACCGAQLGMNAMDVLPTSSFRRSVVWRVNTQTTIRFSRSKLTCSFDLPADRDQKAVILGRGSDPLSLGLPPTRANRRFLRRMRGVVEKS